MFEEDQAKQMVLQRQLELEKEFKEELPRQLFPYKEFFGMRYLYVFAVYMPLIVLGGYITVTIFNAGKFNVYIAPVPFLPLIVAFLLFQVKDPNRQNITFASMMRKSIQFKRRKKLFVYQKEESQEFNDDIRSKTGIFNITKDCYETLDDALVKVLQITPINLDTLSYREKKKVIESWENFIEEAPDDWFPIMTANYAKPVNLSTHLEEVEEKARSGNKLQQALANSYIAKGKEIQGDRLIVTKLPYYPVRVEGVSETSLKELNKKTMLIKGKLEDMLQGRLKLKVQVLDNEQLFQLIYSIIDYENSQVDLSYDTQLMKDFTVTEEEYIEAQEKIKELEKTQIL